MTTPARLALAGLLALVLGAGPLLGDPPSAPPGEWTRAFQRGDYPRAIALAGERIRAQPGDVEARIVLARAKAAQGRFEAAYEGFRKALRIDPRSTDALYYLGITAGVLAQSEYERLFTLAPGSARAHQLQGDSYEAQGQRREAEVEYKAALLASPKSVEVLVALGDLTRRDAAYDEAITYYSRAAELAPRNYDVLYGLGVCHSFRQEHAKAVEYFRQALRREPDSAPAHLALGSSLLQTGQTPAAVTELEAARRLEPRMRQAYFLLGRAYRALGRSSEAEAAFARVQELVRQEGEAAEANLEDRPHPRQPPDPR
jgi:tetratricopeptide (TPR) repeat protein